MTLQEEIQAKIDAIEAKCAEDVAPLKAELQAGGTHLGTEWDSFEAHIKEILAKVRAAL